MKKDQLQSLFSVSAAERKAIVAEHIAKGVAIPFPDTVFIDKTAVVAPGAILLANTILLGSTSVATDCVIGPNTTLFDVSVGSGTVLNNVEAETADVGESCDIGPFVHIRPNSRLSNNVHLGNFVEVKNSTVDSGTKVSHLTYVGDSDVGKNCNFGCGTVTVNYDGRNKARCTIGEHCFIGCNTNLIAPVTVGDFAYTAAGSTITDNVPADALAIARARQVNKENWVLEKKPYKDR